MSTCKYLYCEVQLTYVHGSYLVTCQGNMSMLYHNLPGNHGKSQRNHNKSQGNHGKLQGNH